MAKLRLWVLAVVLLFLALFPAGAVILDGAFLNSTGISLTINISSLLNASEVLVASDSIWFSNVSYVNPAQASKGDLISYNITHPNKDYGVLELPYISSSSNYTKMVVNGLDLPVDGSLIMPVKNCNIGFIRYDGLGTTYDRDYNSSFWSCASNTVRLNYTDLTTGSSTFYIVDATVATNCSEGNVTLWFNIRDEDYPTVPLDAVAEVELNYWYPATPFYVRNFTLEYSGNSTYGICLSNNLTTLNADLYIKYTTDNGFTHRYILANNTLNVADVQNISIYNFNTTTGISDLKITTRKNADYKFYPEIIGKLQRRYTAEGVWRTVQMDKSGDFGLLFYNIREENIDYRLIFTDMQNNILKTTETIKFSCTSAICELTVLLDPYSATAASSAIIAILSYDNDTQMLTMDWVDELAGTRTVHMTATQGTVTGVNYLCNMTQTGAAGTMDCNLTGRSGVVEVTVTGSGVYLKEYIDIITGKIGNLIGKSEGAFWAVMIMITCIMFGVFSPVGAIITMFIGLLLTYLLGIFTPLTTSFIVIAAVAGIAIGFKVRN
uniref:Uncharacterized protein n=2 Tax=viral metagenome TaxID=1070528 RepID=A0A6M3JWJ6_9ZZZZ